MRRLVISVVVCCVSAMSVAAAVFIAPSDEQMVRESAVIVSGTILGEEVVQGERGIETIYSLAVDETIKGSVTGDVLEFREYGGILGDRWAAVSGGPSYRSGHRYLIFFVPGKDGGLTTKDLALGRYEFRFMQGRSMLVRNLDGLEIQPWSDAEERNVRPAERFLETVRELARRYPDREVPVRENFTIREGISLSANDLDTAGASVKGAGQWSESSVVDYAVSGTAASANTKDPFDGEDRIIVDDPNNDITGSFTGSGTLAVAFYGGSVLSDRLRITGSDIVVQDGVSTSTGIDQDRYNTMMTHEMGHTLGFRHSNQNKYSESGTSCTASFPCTSNAVMNSSVVAGYDGVLQSWDLNGRSGNYTTLASLDAGYLTHHTSNDLPWHRDDAVVSWRISGAATPSDLLADFDVNGSEDLVWRSASKGRNSVWLMTGTTHSSTVFLDRVNDSTWDIATVADFDGDGDPDLLWRNTTDGRNSVWIMDGTTMTTSVPLDRVSDMEWSIVGAGDLTGDGKTDIVWRNRTRGKNSIWEMDGTSRVQSIFLENVTDSEWNIQAVADLTGDGKDDIVWRNRTRGKNSVWEMDGTSRVQSIFLENVTDSDWGIDAAADYTGDGKVDLVWRNNVNGKNSVWEMDGTTRVQSIFLETVTDTSWNIAGPK